eukprot:TRINITY_DN9792_c0_g1_i1.p1 TRINITY_DN9792_c0_g1~~TRINITY_DN9792_c0_g1_i1.p1  ORF type:complete len:548 (-),score=31.87 TRINITY_DN9792_c0_g1_i1:57-1700(-)
MPPQSQIDKEKKLAYIDKKSKDITGLARLPDEAPEMYNQRLSEAWERLFAEVSRELYEPPAPLSHLRNDTETTLMTIMCRACPLPDCIGEIPGCAPGTLFRSRAQLRALGHCNKQVHGIITKSQDDHAVAIALFMGSSSSDDTMSEDGRRIIYHAQGRGEFTGKHRNQTLEGANAALSNSGKHSVPIRVYIRLQDNKLQYVGLYTVEGKDKITQPDGHRMWLFDLQAQGTIQVPQTTRYLPTLKIPVVRVESPKLIEKLGKALAEVNLCCTSVREFLEEIDSIGVSYTHCYLQCLNQPGGAKPTLLQILPSMNHWPWALCALTAGYGLACIQLCTLTREQLCKDVALGLERYPIAVKLPEDVALPMFGYIAHGISFNPSAKPLPHSVDILENLEIFWTGDRGFGIRTTEWIPADTIVMTYTGLYCDSDLGEELPSAYLVELVPSTVTSTHVDTVDAAVWGNVSRFINHSCEPNLTISLHKTDKSEDAKLEPSLVFETVEDVPPDTELTWFYGDVYFEHNPSLHCLCGHQGCKFRNGVQPKGPKRPRQ